MFYVVAILFTISQLAHVAKQDAWLAAVLALIVSFAILMIAWSAGPRHVNIAMPHWIEYLLGGFVGRLVNILYLFFFMLMGAVVLRHIVEIVGIAALPLTPRVVILALFALPAALAARLGIEVLARTAQIYIMISLFAFAVIVVGIGPAVKLHKLQPILARGLGPVMTASIPSIALFSFVMIGLWFTPYLQDRRGLITASGWALFMIGSLAIVSTVYSQGIFGYIEMEGMLLPVLSMVRSIRLGRVIERLDVLLLSSWLLASFLMAALFIYLASLQLAWIGGSRHYRAFTFPIAALLTALGLTIARSDAQIAEFINVGSFAPYVLLHTLGIPILLVVARLIRGSSSTTKHRNTEEAP